jgi:hypothetical protein
MLPLGVAATLYFLRFRLPLPGWSRWWLGLLALVVAATASLTGGELYQVEWPPEALIEPIRVAGTVYFGALGALAAGLGLALRRGVAEKGDARPWNARAMIWFVAGWVAVLCYAFQRVHLLHDEAYLETVRFTDWIAGHHHLLLLSGMGAWAFGVTDELWPELRRCEAWRLPFFADVHVILTLGGAWIMVGTLFTAGWLQSTMAREMVPWSAITEASAGFWLVRVIAGSVVVGAQVLWLINLVATRDRSLPKLREPVELEAEEPEILEGFSEGMPR